MTAAKNFFASKSGIISVGVFIGIVAPLLQKFGNPGNMGTRVILGGLGPDRAACIAAKAACQDTMQNRHRLPT
jgi:hypothetical protein